MKYEHGVPANWQVGLGRLTVNDVNEVPTLQGPCPRCDHPIELALTQSVGAGLAPGPNGAVKIVLHCNCVEEHEGRQATGRGCGAFGGVVIEL